MFYPFPNKMKIKKLLHQLGYSETEANVFFKIYQYGPKPASSIASLCKLDRTYCYKVLRKLHNNDLIHESINNGTKQFFVPNLSAIQAQINKQQQSAQQLSQDFLLAKKELTAMDAQRSPFVPQMKIFEGEQAIGRCLQDILTTIQNEQLLTISMFSSHTFTAQVQQLSTVAKQYQDFITTLQNRKIHIDAYLGSGILVMDQIHKVTDYSKILQTSP